MGFPAVFLNFFIEKTPVIQPRQRIRIGAQQNTLFKRPFLGYVPANEQFSDKTVENIDNRLFADFDNPLDPAIGQSDLQFSGVVRFRIFNNGLFSTR